MIQLQILCLSLFLIPLLGSFTIGPFISIQNPERAKEFFAIVSIIAMSISSTVWRIYPNRKRSHNFFLYAMVLFIPLSIYSSPPLRLTYGFHNLGNLWLWKSSLWIAAYFILYRCIIFIPILMEDHKLFVGKAIGFSAILSSGYAYLQFLGLDQWMFTNPNEWIGSPKAANITAMVGNPTFLGVWLVICLPFIYIFFKKRWVFFVAGAAIITQSDFAIAGILFLIVFMTAMRVNRTVLLKVAAICAMFSIIAVWTYWGDVRPHITDNSRFGVWQQTFKDWKGPCITLAVDDTMSKAQRIEVQNLNKRTYVFTGRGPGSFPYIFGVKHNSPWESPHNVYLLCLYSIGLIGTVLFVLAIGWILIRSFDSARGDPLQLALYCSAVYICLAAIGTPIMESETLRYFAVAIFAMLSPSKIKNKIA